MDRVSANSKQTCYDESRWPFVVITPAMVHSDADFEAMFARVRSYYERGQHFGLVMDIRTSATLQSEQRRILVDAFDDNVRRFGSLLVGVGIVLTSAVARGGFKAIMWLRQSPEPPAKAFSSPEAAMDWVRELYQVASPAAAVASSVPSEGAVCVAKCQSHFGPATLHLHFEATGVALTPGGCGHDPAC